MIDVAYANITFVETQIRAGNGPFPVNLPMIPGNGVGGWLDGRRVVASLNGSGGYAEQAAGGEVFEVPDGLALDDAVALLADGRTATLLTDAAAIQPGERVLILAAAGGVGTLLTQLALRAGAEVTGAASHFKHDVVTSLGATATNYELKRPGRSSLVFDGVGGEVARRAFEALEPGGRMLSYGLASGAWADISAEEAGARDVTLVRAGRPTREHTERALRSGLRPVIGQRFALEEAAAAHAAIEARATTGKTLLVVQGE
ncbi:zinc-binding dehydrogenase [Solirubrobacter phytolaccae]|uniref:Zinc-binding dehydrogenase n=1 Tax=Solirubrobacter phytolaccae TaxID=1404360 RepID=A0A9X3N835_9ACTN|nr:zinc-binding dehydrogenase [Solirubrobacter phytolaccae]MDA0180159.1 zinc-binding dehydrogenase [Solirubrobacter phytolaccae]